MCLVSTKLGFSCRSFELIWYDMKRVQRTEKKENEVQLARDEPKPKPEDPSERSREKGQKNMRVKVNVGGRVFETFTETLCKYPQTRLGVRSGTHRTQKLITEHIYLLQTHWNKWVRHSVLILLFLRSMTKRSSHLSLG